MQRNEDALKQSLLNDALAHAIPGTDASAMSSRFMNAFYHHVPLADLQRRSPAILAQIAHDMWCFAAIRVPKRAAIRVVSRQEAAPGTPIGVAIQIVNDDMRFLVDSTLATLTRLGLVADLIIHPVIPVERDLAFRLLGLDTPSARPESMMHIDIAQDIAPERRDAVIDSLAATLDAVRSVVEDWPSMRGQAHDLGQAMRTAPHVALLPGAAEDAAFLDWLDAGNFVFLGTRQYTFDGTELAVVPGVGHGLLRHDDVLVFDGLRAIARASPDVQEFLAAPQFTMISKSNRRSPIHRPVPMDTVIVKIFDEERRVIGLRLLLGLFTTDSYSRLPHEIPVLRQKVRRCTDRSGFAPDSRDGRALQHVLDTFPRDELFQIDEAQLFDTAMGVLHLKQRPGLALFVMHDPFERFSTCLVYLPRDRFNAEAARRIAGILEQAFSGQISFETTHFEDSTLVRLHFVIATPGIKVHAVSVPDIERRLTEALRKWADRLAEGLADIHGASSSKDWLRRYAQAFPPAYLDHFPVEAALQDIGHIEGVLGGQPIAVVLSHDASPIILRLYHAATPLALSDVLPMLENLGVRVITEIPFEISPRDAAAPVWVQELELQASGDGAKTREDAIRFENAFREVWAGTLESDGFNRLVLGSGLTAREVTVLRTYCKLLRQAGSQFSQAYMEDTASRFPAIAQLLVHLFELRADPTAEAGRTQRTVATQASIQEALEKVENLDEDRILRSFLLLILNTLRTNYFQRDTDGNPKTYLSIKIASREIDLLPQPRPLVEIFVYSPRMEGCHLRGGRVARGGIRWSDRREDFRTEVLGLMKAQMVKNAVIVPIGSKGGFVVKHMPDGSREIVMAEVVACYKMLMCGLLDLTDNIVANAVVPPPDVVRHDADDTYLVVAADKGTATFSDIANGVAIDYGFWLGDAFASGGSVGYDHKAMGITAKGAWEAIKRHFRETGTDIQSTDFTCVGVGDMSGDVFGNGMMLSRHIRLVAAFNHMHIFIDPDPDPAQSWQERVRLFALPRSSWRDYDTSIISPGGGIYDRKAKSIALSPQARACLGIAAEHIAPNDLIQALLRQDTDLLWFGGIGTYVKASSESHFDAGDRANDSLRVDASTLRARVIGEGANLAITQRARIEYALAGGRINTDAIDNSAGVDTSDHEVNIKIAVGDVIGASLVAPADRAAFLASMVDDVERLVLADNTLQSLALTLAQSQAPMLLDRHAGLMRAMERRGALDRAVEFLPNDEVLAQRATAGHGLTRPEIAVLMAYAKNGLYAELLTTELPDLPEMQAELLAYFPQRLRLLAPTLLPTHRLHREIIATCVANEIINRMGPSFVEDTTARTGRDGESIARATLIVRDVFGLMAIWRDIEALDNRVPATTQTRLWLAIATIVDQAVRWFLLSGLPLDPTVSIATFRPGVEALAADLSALLPNSEREINANREAAHRDAGVPEALAHRIVILNTLSNAMDIIQVADMLDRDVTEIGRIYFEAGVEFGLLLVRRQARLMPAINHWQRLASDALADDSYVLQREVTHRLATTTGQALAGPQLREVLGDIARTSPPDLAMLTVASRRIRTAVANV